MRSPPVRRLYLFVRGSGVNGRRSLDLNRTPLKIQQIDVVLRACLREHARLVSSALIVHRRRRVHDALGRPPTHLGVKRCLRVQQPIGLLATEHRLPEAGCLAVPVQAAARAGGAN
eukprot:562497-Prymnesium_polylepis.1